MVAKEQLQQFASAWDAVALSYERELVPRFRDWTGETFGQLQDLPAGDVFIATCGPGHEQKILAEKFPDRRIIGSDISEAMVKRAQDVIHSHGLSGRVSVEVGDSSYVPKGTNQLAAIASCIGLMVLPAPHEALANWVDALAPGGVLSVSFLSASQAEPNFGRLLGLPYQNADNRNGKQAFDWEAALTKQARKHGAEVVTDKYTRQPMHFASIDEYWEVWTSSIAPFHLLKQNIRETKMQELKQEYIKDTGSPHGKFAIAPSARLLVLRKL